jgi:predicted Zn-dependent protease
MSAKAIFKFLSLVAGTMLVYACVSDIVPATGDKRFVGFTWQEEAEIGKQANKEVSALFGVYRDAKVERYVTEVGNRVLAASHLRRPGVDEQVRSTPVTFGVLDSPIINAMALPGGYVYITRGMLAHLNNEDQLAGVLAHELGHVAARHAARQAWQQKIGQGLMLGGALLGQGLGLPIQDLMNLGGMAAQLILLRHSRGDELEADQLGIEYSSGAGYDPREVTGLFQTLDRMQEKEGQGMPSFLSTHPDPGARVQRIRELTAAMTRDRRTVADSRYMNTIEGLVIGEDPRQGFVEGQMFYHPDLRFSFPVPRGFKVVNQPTQVVMVEGQNRALMGFSATGEKSAQEAAAKFLNQQGLRVVQRGPLRSNQLPAYVAIADAQTENRQIVRLMAYFVEYRGAVYHFLGYAPQQAFGTFRDAFLQTMQGFSELRDPQMLKRQPVRLSIQKVSRSASLRDLLPASLPPPLKSEEVALMNQAELNQRIAVGTIVKVPAVSY